MRHSPTVPTTHLPPHNSHTVGPPFYFICLCWLNAVYCFDYKWGNQVFRPALSSRHRSIVAFVTDPHPPGYCLYAEMEPAQEDQLLRNALALLHRFRYGRGPFGRLWVTANVPLPLSLVTGLPITLATFFFEYIISYSLVSLLFPMVLLLASSLPTSLAEPASSSSPSFKLYC